MTVSSKNKENFRLLDLSSDEESEDLQLEIVPRKKKITRRERHRMTASKVDDSSIRAEIQTAVRWAVKATLVLWLLSLTWACAALYKQVSGMQTEITKVTTSSNGVNDELQLCHTTAKELRVNVSKLGARLAELEEQHLELVKKVEKATGELATVSDQLSAAPKLADTPRRLLELQQTVGTFGSQISGFDSELKSAHQLASTATAGVKEVKTSLLELEARTNGTIANVTKVQQRDEELSTQLVAVNSTLGARVDALQSRIDDATRPASTPLPTTSTSTTTTTVAPPQSPSSAPSTTTMTPGSPEKPKLLKS